MTIQSMVHRPMAPIWVDVAQRLLESLERNDDAVLYIGRAD
jgi:hypothetical protein